MVHKDSHAAIEHYRQEVGDYEAFGSYAEQALQGYSNKPPQSHPIQIDQISSEKPISIL